ncbi:MAG: hypothetical protein LC797_11360, partial [Chloroflexi bacterium]|nr:hypothetical protein [Chloroflexota bacterium]
MSFEAPSVGGDIHSLKVAQPFGTRERGGEPTERELPTYAKASRHLTLRRLYVAALVFWLATRWLVLVHQGAWPWMNSFVVAAARGIVVGDWNDAVRPQLPDLLGVPLVLIRALFPRGLPEQALAMLFFVLVPYDHSIHHYRDIPVVLASSAVFVLCAHFVTYFGARADGAGLAHHLGPLARARVGPTVPRRLLERASGLRLPWLLGAMLLGVWSRFEVLTFVGVLVVLALLVWRRRAVPLAASYAAAALLVTASLLGVYRLEGVDPSEAWFYTAHTFLDSTPDSWLTAQCRADPTENCREADGLSYFGPADLHAGILPLVTGHPLVTLAKTIRSAWDNLW